MTAKVRLKRNEGSLLFEVLNSGKGNEGWSIGKCCGKVLKLC